MSRLATRKLEKRLRDMISRFVKSDLSVAELSHAIPYLLERLREVATQKTHSKFFIDDQIKVVDKFERLYFRSGDTKSSIKPEGEGQAESAGIRTPNKAGKGRGNSENSASQSGKQ